MTYCFLWVFGCLQAQTLPGYKNGSWWIISNNEQLPLPNTFTHLGNFDAQHGFAEFIEQNRYGIINSKGERMIEARFISIEPMGSGLFLCSSDSSTFVLDAFSDSILVSNVLKWNRLNEKYTIVQTTDATSLLMHVPTRLNVELNDSIEILGSYFNTVLLYEVDATRTLFTEEGTVIVLPLNDIVYTPDYITYTEAGVSVLITAKINQKFRNSTNVSVFGDYLSYYDGQLAHLIQLETNQELMVVPYEKIEPASFGGYYVYSNAKMGWMDPSGKVQIPVKYDRIYKSGASFVVENGNLKGQYSSDFELDVPVSFYNYSTQDDWLFTTSILGYQGLYSLKRHKTVLDPQFDKISLENGIFKAYYDNNIRVLEVSENHQVKHDFILPNAITIKQYSFSPYDPAYNYDKRLLQLGWFYVKNEVVDSIRNRISYEYKWGLKNAVDSILIQPIMSAPTYLPNQSFSLTKAGSLDLKSVINRKERVHYSMMRYHQSGKIVSTDQVLEIDTNDCASRNYVRMETTKGYRILLENDSLKKVDFVGSRYGKYVPYCTAKNRFFGEVTDTSVLISHFSLNGKWSNGESFERLSDKMTIRFQSFEEAKWNFLDSNGNDLFSEPFDFVQEFQHDRAIVKRNGKWGITTPDSLLLPLKFSEIKRVNLFDDTVFVVKQNHYGVDFLNENTEKLPLERGEILKSKGELSLIKTGKEFFVFRGSKKEKSYTSSAFLLSETHYALREKKEYFIFDEKGKEIGVSEFKPQEMIGKLLIVSSSAKQGISLQSGDTLIAPTKCEIQPIGNYLVFTTKSGKKVVDLEGNIILQTTPEEQLLIDPITQQIARVYNSKIQLFDTKTNKFSKNKLKTAENVDFFYAGYFFSKTKIQSFDTLFQLGKKDAYVLFENGYFAHTIGDSMTILYHHSLKNQVFKCDAKKIRKIGSSIFCYQTKQGLTLHSSNLMKILPGNTLIVENYNEGFCLVKTGADYYFLDENFENPFHRSFKNATSFNGEFATVKTATGWTIIDRKGNQNSYPSFSEINQEGKGLFLTSKKPTYGVYDNHGNELLAPIFEKVQFISKDIIQVVKQGEIGYYRIDGTPIFELIDVVQVVH